MIQQASDAGHDRSGSPAQLTRTSRMFLIGIVLVAVAARGTALWVWSENLSDDRDVYLALAQGVANGRGFSVPGTDRPTAYRPPLYPLVLVATGASGSAVVRGSLHLILGVTTVWLTYRLGRRLGLSDWLALMAAALVAVDPLLVRYTTFPMTETFVTFLTTLLLLVWMPAAGVWRQLMIGVLLGLSVLSRPTLWAFGGLMALQWLVLRVSEWGRASNRLSSLSRPQRIPWVMLGAVVITVTPWALRNWLVMGHPVVMTTHGGYTLLLGNNPEFYREVVGQPWGTVWDGTIGGGQATWAVKLNRKMDEAGIVGEVARDRWMGSLAWIHIRENPLDFLRACWLRFRRFWSVAPSGGDAAVIPTFVRPLLGIFYGTVYLLALAGLLRAVRCDWRTWGPAVLLLSAFVGVHLVYWSNARMRAPVVPIVALLAARAIERRSGSPLTIQ